MFYVYALTDPRYNNRVFYIGKGKGYRATNHLKPSANRDRTSKQNTIKAIRKCKKEPSVVYVFTDLTEIGAFALERYLIRWYGRKDLGLGFLTNLTDGGEGVSGHKHSDETKLKMKTADRSAYTRVAIVTAETKKKLSIRRQGQTPAKGLKWTDEQKLNLSKIKTGSPCPTKGKHRVYREDGSFYFQ